MFTCCIEVAYLCYLCSLNAGRQVLCLCQSGIYNNRIQTTRYKNRFDSCGQKISTFSLKKANRIIKYIRDYRKDEASPLVLSLYYWSSIRASWAELVPQATDRMTIFIFISSEAKNFSWSHSLCKEHAKHCLSSGEINGYNCVDLDLSFQGRVRVRAGPCDRRRTQCAFGFFRLQRWLTSSFMHTNIISNWIFYIEILLPYHSQF